MSTNRQRRPMSRGAVVYMRVWLGGLTAWMAHTLFVTHGWQRMVTAVLLVWGVVVLVMFERDRRRRARQSPPEPATRE